ncbi:hypothetical protein GCM10011399_25130 [Subtercola lobariae]|uniref:Uncharacterized protein n=1 Tax=Subtercola lobariae TaxID=1588641 RepID=A0A917B9K8_9MICO|nr:hypothetical protein GCM10011399_25130 [Subtercola lobariae]
MMLPDADNVEPGLLGDHRLLDRLPHPLYAARYSTSHRVGGYFTKGMNAYLESHGQITPSRRRQFERSDSHSMLLTRQSH